MTQLEELNALIQEFRRARNWHHADNPKDHALSVVLEASELLEHFQWKNGDAIRSYLGNGGLEEVKNEMADVFIYLLTMANDLGVDLDAAVRKKIVLNGVKYPVETPKEKAEA